MLGEARVLKPHPRPGLLHAARHVLLHGVVIRNMMGTAGELSMKYKCGATYGVKPEIPMYQYRCIYTENERHKEKINRLCSL